jgi:nucleoside-diphosphate-sugar epimerase
MTASAKVAAVTGASGYLGSRICTTLEACGWLVVRLVRSPTGSHQPAASYDLAGTVSSEVKEVLKAADVLVHAAYDLSLTNPVDIWRVNVDGTRRLLEAASGARVRRTLVLSSMSAFEGTSQLYGRAKLDIEAMTVASGGCALRPGLVCGDRPGGMAAALRKLSRLPIAPVIAGGARQYTVLEDDFTAAIAALATVESLPPGTVSLAHPIPVLFRDLLEAFALDEGRAPRFVPVPWPLVYLLLRTGELLHFRLPFRADSLLGLVHAAPGVGDEGPLKELGVTLHAFGSEPVGQK